MNPHKSGVNETGGSPLSGTRAGTTNDKSAGKSRDCSRCCPWRGHVSNSDCIDPVPHREVGEGRDRRVEDAGTHRSPVHGASAQVVRGPVSGRSWWKVVSGGPYRAAPYTFRPQKRTDRPRKDLLEPHLPIAATPQPGQLVTSAPDSTPRTRPTAAAVTGLRRCLDMEPSNRTVASIFTKARCAATTSRMTPTKETTGAKGAHFAVPVPLSDNADDDRPPSCPPS
jgi:hypothetical protein